jgi:MFS superfamily sulfate permease-like transporter
LDLQTGLLLLALGLLRVGFLDNVLSRPLLCGFVNAVATTIILEQLDALFGLPSDHEHGWRKFIHWVENVHLTHWVTLCMGIITIYIIFMIKFLKSRFAFMKYVPETMIVVIAGTLVTGLSRLDQIGVSVLGEITQGFPVPRPPRLDQFQVVASQIPSAALIAIIGFIEHIVAAKVYATKHNYPISANRELVALGVSNTMGSFFHTYPTFASLTRSAVADSMGAQSQIYSLITSFIILFTMLFLGSSHFASFHGRRRTNCLLIVGPLFYYLPKVVMAGIITSAAIGLFEIHDIVFLVQIRVCILCHS